MLIHPPTKGLFVALLALSTLVAGCGRPDPPAPAHPADPARVPKGRGWFASTIDLGRCTRVCETRPGAMQANGTAPVSDCASSPTAYCFTFDGPSNAGEPVQCACDAPTCENRRRSVMTADYGGPIRSMSDCTRVP